MDQNDNGGDNDRGDAGHAGDGRVGENGADKIVSLASHPRAKVVPLPESFLLALPPHLAPFVRRDANGAGLSVDAFLNQEFMEYLEAYYEDETRSLDDQQLNLLQLTLFPNAADG